MSRSLGLAARPVVCLVAVISAIHLALIPVLAQEATPQSRPIASPAPAPILLDLAAMTLTPTDLADVGLSGFTVADGRAESREDRIANQVAEGADPQAVRTNLTRLGWTREHRSRLARPTTPGEEDFDLLVTSSVTQYADAEGAVAGYRAGSLYLVHADDETPVPGTQPIGAQSQVLAIPEVVTSDGKTFQGTRLYFQHGALIGDVIAFATPGITVSVATGQALASRLIERIDAVLADGGPGLSFKVLRLQGIGLGDPDLDNYLKLAGDAYLGLGETDEESGARTASFAEASDLYQYEALVTKTLFQQVDLAVFPAARLASTRVQRTLVRARAELPSEATVGVVADAPAFGDESVVLRVSVTIEGDQFVGYGVVARHGSRVVGFALISLGDLSLAGFLELAAMQVACLVGDACLESVPLPAGLV
jgi:hypothetical protein